MALARPGRPAVASVAWALVGGAATVEGRLKTRPPSRRGAWGPRRLQRGAGASMNGLEYLLSGYDIYFGSPAPTNGAVDEGFRSQVFKASSGSETLPDGTSLPDGVSALQCEDSCSLLSTELSIKSLKEYDDFLTLRVYAGVEFGDVASFSASEDYKRVQESFQSQESVYTTVTATCCAYKACLHSFKPPPADDNFLAAVDMAPEGYDQDFYFGLIGEFGTHFLSDAQLGSMYGEETRFTKDQYNDLTATHSNWSLMAQASFVVSVNASASNGEDLSSAKFFEKYSTQTLKYSLGAKPSGSSWSASAWLTDTLKVEPVPTSMKLKPLSELFTALIVPHMTNATKLKAKRENMERALQEYCPEKLLKEGTVASCAKVTGSPGAAADDKTCLAKVWGGGGPKGQLFDDSAAMVELNGLFTNLRVQQIEGFSQRWLDNIQLELALGTDTWALPKHGGNGGVNSLLTFSDDQKIIAVDLWYAKYIHNIHFWTDDGGEHVLGGSGGTSSKTVDFRDAVRNATGYLPRSAWLVGLYGNSHEYVDSLGFYVAYTCPSSEAPGPAGLASAPNLTAGGAAAAGPPG